MTRVTDAVSTLTGLLAAKPAAIGRTLSTARPDTQSTQAEVLRVTLPVTHDENFRHTGNAVLVALLAAGARLPRWVASLTGGVVLALGFLLILSMTATTVLQVAFAQLPSILPALGYVTSLLLYAVGFAFMYHYLPDRRVAWRQAFIGGVITSALFALGRYGIGVYIATVAPGSAYGSMGALVISLVWIYYATVVFFVGALMTAVIDERLRARHHLAAAGIDPATASQVPDRG